MKKRVFSILSLLLVVVCLSACVFSRKALTPEGFSVQMREMNFNVEDYSQHYQGLLQTALVATGDDGIKVEFFVTEDNEQAKNAFEENKLMFEEQKGDVSTEKNSSGTNYSKYELTTNGLYMAVCRIDNTLVFLMVDEALKPRAQEVLETLGY